MTPAEVAGLLQDLGGYGVAGVMFYLYRAEKAERMRYRNLHEQVLSDLPAMTRALEDLTGRIKERIQ